MSDTTRIRAWVLVKVRGRNVIDVARELYGSSTFKSGSEIIRADIVAGPYDIVVPIDAETKEALLDLVANRVLATEGVEETLTLVVVQHFPEPPHATKGYVSDSELDIESNPGFQIRDDNVWG